MTGFLEYVQFVLAPQMITGLALGIAVVLVALGLTIIFGLLDVINMAHGEFYAVGAYLALALGASGISFWVLLIIVPLLMLPLGYAIERGLIQRVFNLPDRHVTTLLLTFGLGLVIEEGLKVVFGSNTQRPPTPISGAIEVMGVLLPKYRLFLIVIGFAIVAAVAIVINKTRLGALVRAAAFDRNMAASLGVPVSRVFALTFALGVALAGLAVAPDPAPSAGRAGRRQRRDSRCGPRFHAARRRGDRPVRRVPRRGRRGPQRRGERTGVSLARGA